MRCGARESFVWFSCVLASFFFFLLFPLVKTTFYMAEMLWFMRNTRAPWNKPIEMKSQRVFGNDLMTCHGWCFAKIYHA